MPKPAHPIEPALVSHDVAAHMLGQISPRLLSQIVASGRLKARRISDKRIGYLRRDIIELAESLPVVTIGGNDE